MPEFEKVKVPVDLDVTVRTTYEGDQRPPVRERSYYDRDRPSNPYPSFISAGALGAILIAAAIIALPFVAYAFGPHPDPNQQACGDNALCWKAQVEITRAQEYRRLGVGVAQANAYTGFGTDSAIKPGQEGSWQTAVKPRPKKTVRYTASPDNTPDVTIVRPARCDNCQGAAPKAEPPPVAAAEPPASAAVPTPAPAAADPPAPGVVDPPAAPSEGRARPTGQMYVPPAGVMPRADSGRRYTGKSCIRRDGSIGREGYGPNDQLGCWRA